jgi:hypothetical protein
LSRLQSGSIDDDVDIGRKKEHRLTEHTASAKGPRPLPQGPFRDLYAGRLKLGNGDGWRDCFIENRHRGLSTGCPQAASTGARRNAFRLVTIV